MILYTRDILLIQRRQNVYYISFLRDKTLTYYYQSGRLEDQLATPLELSTSAEVEFTLRKRFSKQQQNLLNNSSISLK